MRVLHLTTESRQIGGAEQLLLDLLKEPRDPGDEFGLATLRPAGLLQDRVGALGHRTFSLEITGLLGLGRAPVAMARVLRDFRPDIVHSHLFHASVVAAILVPRSGLPLLQTRHYSSYFEQSGTRLHLAIDRWAASRCHGLAAISPAVRDFLIDQGTPADRVVLIQNGVAVQDLESIAAEDGKKALAAAGVRGARVIGSAARLHPLKGLDVLLGSFKSVLHEHPQVELAIIGDGPERVRLEKLAAELGIASRVFFLGYRNNARELISGLDVYVQPSIEEGFGIAVIEAMAVGTPVVVSDVGGMKETVEHGVTGLRVPASRSDELAHALIGMLADPRRTAGLASAARSRVRDRFSIKATAASYSSWYRRVLT